MKSANADVIRWRRLVDLKVGELPELPNFEESKAIALPAIWVEAAFKKVQVDTRISSNLKIIFEEFREFLEAIANRDLEGIADGGADIIYTVLGYLSALGVDAAPIWAEVQKKNIEKQGGGKDANGKAVKPPGWQPPDIAGVLARQRPLSETYPADEHKPSVEGLSKYTDSIVCGPDFTNYNRANRGVIGGSGDNR